MSLEIVISELVTALKEYTALLRQVSNGIAPSPGETAVSAQTQPSKAKPATAVKPAKAAPTVTQADVAKAIGAVVATLGRVAAIDLLGRHGAAKTSELAADAYSAIKAEADTLLAAAAAQAEADPTA